MKNIYFIFIMINIFEINSVYHWKVHYVVLAYKNRSIVFTINSGHVRGLYSWERFRKPWIGPFDSVPRTNGARPMAATLRFRTLCLNIAGATGYQDSTIDGSNVVTWTTTTTITIVTITTLMMMAITKGTFIRIFLEATAGNKLRSRSSCRIRLDRLPAVEDFHQ